MFQDLEISKYEMPDLINNADLSNKEKKTQSWRKEMEGYQAEWEKLNARSNSRTRDSSYKDTGRKDDAANEYRKGTNTKTVKIDIKPSYQKEINHN